MAQDPKNKNKDGGKSKDKDRRTAKDYGFVKAFLDDHPRIGRLVRKAVKEQWTPERFQTEIQDTSWWRDRANSQRKAEVLEANDPGEWSRMVSAMEAQVRVEIGQMGIDYSDAEIKKYAESAVRNGYSAQEVTSYLAGHGALDVDDADGAASVTVDAFRQMAAMYGLKMSDSTLTAKVREALGSGNASGFISGYEDTLREQAKMMYPSIADKLDTMSLRDIASPFLETAAQELGVDPNSLDLTDPKWTRMFRSQDGTLMNPDQWMATLRSDQAYGWGKTNNAKNQAGDFAQRIAALMRGGVGV